MSEFHLGFTAGNLPPSVPLQFTTDSGIAVPSGNNVNISGGSTGLTFSAFYLLFTQILFMAEAMFLWRLQVKS